MRKEDLVRPSVCLSGSESGYPSLNHLYAMWNKCKRTRRMGSRGYIEDDLMENYLKSIFRAFSSLGNWIMISTEVALMDNVLMEEALIGICSNGKCPKWNWLC